MPVIEFKDETRRYFDGLVTEEINLNKLPKDIKVFGDVIKFPKSGNGMTFQSWDDCEKYMDTIIPTKSNDFKITKELHSIKSKALELTDMDWELMKSFMVKPERFQKEDFRIYEAWLAHNSVDRDEERFSKGVLDSFAKSIVGKALLMGHNWGGTGDGRYFQAEVTRISVDEAYKIAGSTPKKNFLSELQTINDKDGGIFWLVTKYYVLAKDENIIDRLDSGIMSDMSIGFRAPKLEKITDDDNEKVLWWEYQNSESREAEALEGSLVFLGSQYGARTRKDFDGKTINVNEQNKDTIIMNTEKFTLNLKFEAGDLTLEKQIEIETDEEQFKNIENQVNEFLESLKTEVSDRTDIWDASKSEAEEAKAVVSELEEKLGKDYDVDELVKLQKMKIETIEKAAKEAVKYGQLAGLIEKENAEKRMEFFQKLELPEIEMHVDEYRKAYEEKNPPAGKLLETGDSEKQELPNKGHNYQAPIN